MATSRPMRWQPGQVRCSLFSFVEARWPRVQFERAWGAVEACRAEDEGTLLNGIYCAAELAGAPPCVEPFLSRGAAPLSPFPASCVANHS